MLALLLFLSLQPEIRLGALYPVAISGQRELGAIYFPSLSMNLSSREFTLGFYADLFYKKINPFEGRYFQDPDMFISLWAGGLGGNLRWEFWKLATAKVGLGYYYGYIDRTALTTNGGVAQAKARRNSLGVFMAWDIFKVIAKSKLGAEFKINYVPFGSRSTGRLSELESIDLISLTGAGLSIMFRL